ncbi:MAG: PhoH family protein [Deltaproteobacteria bacterium]|nr:PhoH family protein [Deltaproteobacteria bacterium]
MHKHKRSHENKIIHLTFEDNNLARDLFGSEDRHLRSLEKMLGIDIHVRGSDLRIEGPHKDAQQGEKILSMLYQMLRQGNPLMGSEIENALKLLSRDRHANIENIFSETIFFPAKRKALVPRTISQKRYLDLIRTHDVVFSIGPAGTGKTYLAVAMAVTSLLRKEVKRIILARPAVEAGEKLGFLPGDLQEKINPYLRPLYDALYDMLEPERVTMLMEEDVIEVAPLAFMRGRTLHESFIILDEAQNCSYHQMKMCLTRMGMNSKMVVTGDITQVDLPSGMPSGLVEACRILEGEEGVGFHRFTDKDVIRHPLVQRIVTAYERDENHEE